MVEAVAVLFCYEEVFWAVSVLAAVTRGSRCCQKLLFLLFCCRQYTDCSLRLHCKNPCHYICFNIIEERHQEQLKLSGTCRSDVIIWREMVDNCSFREQTPPTPSNHHPNASVCVQRDISQWSTSLDVRRALDCVWDSDWWPGIDVHLTPSISLINLFIKEILGKNHSKVFILSVGTEQACISPNVSQKYV